MKKQRGKEKKQPLAYHFIFVRNKTKQNLVYLCVAKRSVWVGRHNHACLFPVFTFKCDKQHFALIYFLPLFMHPGRKCNGGSSGTPISV